eukprot:1747912-Amphidinium_carterae.1
MSSLTSTLGIQLVPADPCRFPMELAIYIDWTQRTSAKVLCRERNNQKFEQLQEVCKEDMSDGNINKNL